MVDLITGISSSFNGGWIEAVSSLGSMAYGARRYDLIGQYAQAAAFGYVLCEIPFCILWGCSMRKIILLMGFDEEVADLAQDFVWIAVEMNILEGIHGQFFLHITCVEGASFLIHGPCLHPKTTETVFEFLEVIEEEAYANIMGCIDSVSGVILMAVFAPRVDRLSILGLILIINEAVFLVLNIAIPKMAGWIEPYEHGLFGKLSLNNEAVVRRLWKTALPLSVGSFLASAEWELLTIFAAVLGPAEAVRCLICVTS